MPKLVPFSMLVTYLPAAALHLPYYQEPGLSTLENCLNNAGFFEFDVIVITKPVLTCSANDLI